MMPRKATWALVLWTGLAVFICAGIACEKCTGTLPNTTVTCQVAQGGAITVVAVLWFLGFIVLSLIWLMSRPHHRLCPQCGRDVKQGRIACKACGYSFRQVPDPAEY